MLTKEEIKEFLSKDLFEESFLGEIPDEARYELLSKFVDVIYLRFINKLTELLPEEVAERLENDLKEQNIDDFQSLVEEYVPNYNEVLEEIIAEEKKMLLEVLKK